MQLHVGNRLKLRWSTAAKAVPGPDGNKVLIHAPVSRHGNRDRRGGFVPDLVRRTSPGLAERFWYRAEQLSGFEEVTR